MHNSEVKWVVTLEWQLQHLQIHLKCFQRYALSGNAIFRSKDHLISRKSAVQINKCRQYPTFFPPHLSLQTSSFKTKCISAAWQIFWHAHHQQAAVNLMYGTVKQTVENKPKQEHICCNNFGGSWDMSWNFHTCGDNCDTVCNVKSHMTTIVT